MGDSGKLSIQLTPVESLRATVLIEEALQQLAFLGRLAKDPKTVKSNGPSASSGNEIIRLIGEQRELDEIHQKLSEEKQRLKGMHDREACQEVDAKLNDVSTKLKEANRDLCKNLRQAPNIQANMMKLNRERQRVEEWLRETVTELKATNTFKCLIDNVAAEKHAQERLAEARRRNREMSQALRLLEAELKKEAAEYAESRRVANLEITNLKEELQKLRAKAAIKLNFQEKYLRAQQEGLEWKQGLEERQQEEELFELQKETDMESFIYTADAGFSNIMIKQLQAERERQHQIHQKVNAEKQKELTLLLKRQNSIARALGIAQSRIEEEERAARELAAAEQRQAWIAMQRAQQHEKETHAAALLQHFARGFLQRVQEAEKAAQAAKKKSRAKQNKTNK